MSFRQLPLVGKGMVIGLGTAAVAYVGASFIPDEIESYKTVIQLVDTTERQRQRIVDAAKIVQESDDSNPILKKHFTQEVAESLKGFATKYHNSLLDIVEYGVRNPSATIPFNIPDIDSMAKFGKLLRPLIAEFRDGNVKQPPSDLCQPGVFDELEPLDKDKRYIQGYTVECRRSLGSHHFVTGSVVEELFDTEYRIKQGIQNTGLGGHYYSYSSPADMKWLQDHKVDVEPAKEFEAKGGKVGWPRARGVFVDDSGTVVVYVNRDDHVKLVVKGDDLKGAMERTADILKKMEEHDRVYFARDPELGYLSCDPRAIGTGLKVKANVKLQGLSDKVKSNLKDSHLSANEVASKGGWTTFEISHGQPYGLSESQVVREINDELAVLLKSEQRS